MNGDAAAPSLTIAGLHFAYPDGSVDAVVLDPPYMEGLLRAKAETRGGLGSHAALRSAYSSGREVAGPASGRWHQAVLDLYLEACGEARRVLTRWDERVRHDEVVVTIAGGIG